MCVSPSWAIAYHTNSRSPRALKWYRVTRLVHADGKWFELYWHPDVNYRRNNVQHIRDIAKVNELTLLPGVWRDAPSPRNGPEMERVK